MRRLPICSRRTRFSSMRYFETQHVIECDECLSLLGLCLISTSLSLVQRRLKEQQNKAANRYRFNRHRLHSRTACERIPSVVAGVAGGLLTWLMVGSGVRFDDPPDVAASILVLLLLPATQLSPYKNIAVGVRVSYNCRLGRPGMTRIKILAGLIAIACLSLSVAAYQQQE